MKFDFVITVGNLLSVTAVILGVLAVWHRNLARLDQVEQRLRAAESGIKEQDNICRQTLSCRASQHEQIMSEISVLKNDIHWIKNKMINGSH